MSHIADTYLLLSVRAISLIFMSEIEIEQNYTRGWGWVWVLTELGKSSETFNDDIL